MKVTYNSCTVTLTAILKGDADWKVVESIACSRARLRAVCMVGIDEHLASAREAGLESSQSRIAAHECMTFMGSSSLTVG
jgi:hypothetical protein